MQLATKRTPIDMADGTIMYKVHEHGCVGGNRVELDKDDDSV